MILLAWFLVNPNTTLPTKTTDPVQQVAAVKLTLDSNGTYIYEYPKQHKAPVCSAVSADGRPVDVDARKHFATVMGEPNQTVDLTCKRQ